MHITEANLLQAAKQFNNGQPYIKKLKGGLINASYRVEYPDGKSIFLQRINHKIFSSPADIIHNYRAIYDHLHHNKDMHIPAMLETLTGEVYWIDESGYYWRAIDYIEKAYSPLVVDKPEDAYVAANCFSGFTRALAGLDPTALHIVLPDFHNLALRYEQFEEALEKGNKERIEKAPAFIKTIKQRDYLVDFYKEVIASDQFRQRIMHHDCKISNILFRQNNPHQVICPIDLDTVMPGYYFSDLGDMIRTMSCNRDENSRDIEHIKVVPDFYNALLKGYMKEMKTLFTAEEIKNIHISGLLMIYMQAIRFLADYFMEDHYYHVDYPEQNFMRTANQLKLLEELEAFLKQQLAIKVSPI